MDAFFAGYTFDDEDSELLQLAMNLVEGADSIPMGLDANVQYDIYNCISKIFNKCKRYAETQVNTTIEHTDDDPDLEDIPF